VSGPPLMAVPDGDEPPEETGGHPPWMDENWEPVCEPWDRCRGERGSAWGAFQAYRDMGSARSLRSISKQLGRSFATISKMSSRWWWQERVRHWDNKLNGEMLEAQIEEVRDMAKFHANLSRQTLNLVARRIVGDPAAGVDPLDPGKLTAGDIARLLSVAAGLERLSRGEPTERIAGQIEGAEDDIAARAVLGDPMLALRLREIEADIEQAARRDGAP
jgi:hypothetical protein